LLILEALNFFLESLMMSEGIFLEDGLQNSKLSWA
jgi:hypothetical protein